ncbi:splicing factor, proline- and glutamine-rich-like isoform X2 [Rhinolophus ferrumequinum]|uniref:splicing factor, proline- and glutamine-rich-like isoform X2 n=1 Tax=Rhinolophus ferrumequinum TaxID=59479 RepID=UPI00140FFA2A|nr:splicing factor, proline- and glutamine-rich-like isoform X2 [Rhinolophus ferrumequinum]
MQSFLGQEGGTAPLPPRGRSTRVPPPRQGPPRGQRRPEEVSAPPSVSCAAGRGAIKSAQRSHLPRVGARTRGGGGEAGGARGDGGLPPSQLSVPGARRTDGSCRVSRPRSCSIPAPAPPPPPAPPHRDRGDVASAATPRTAQRCARCPRGARPARAGGPPTPPLFPARWGPRPRGPKAGAGRSWRATSGTAGGRPAGTRGLWAGTGSRTGRLGPEQPSSGARLCNLPPRAAPACGAAASTQQQLSAVGRFCARRPVPTRAVPALGGRPRWWELPQQPSPGPTRGERAPNGRPSFTQTSRALPSYRGDGEEEQISCN